MVTGGTPSAPIIGPMPRPSPSVNRPSVSRCIVVAYDAVTIGWRVLLFVAAVAMRMRSVTEPAAPDRVQASFTLNRSEMNAVPRPIASAAVTAVDISAELLAAAAELSAHVRPPIAFQQADAEQLPFEDGCFDRVISTFGVIFAAYQEQAAGELGRVCRRGGRLCLATWAPEGAVADFF